MFVCREVQSVLLVHLCVIVHDWFALGGFCVCVPTTLSDVVDIWRGVRIQQVNMNTMISQGRPLPMWLPQNFAASLAVCFCWVGG